LLCDEQEKVKISTFTEYGDIFLQIESRFMIFNKNGDFIDDLEFNDVEKEIKLIKENKNDKDVDLSDSRERNFDFINPTNHKTK
jgi:hypothetical protein